MSIETYQGVIENGQIKLLISVKLPEKARVYVLIDDEGEKPERKFDLSEMAAKMPKNYKPREEDFGKPVGKEIW